MDVVIAKYFVLVFSILLNNKLFLHAESAGKIIILTKARVKY